MIINNSMFPAQFNYRSIADMRSDLDVLQQQLSTGQKSQTLSGLGGDRVVDMTLRSRLSALDSYKQNVDMVNIRINFMSTTMSRVDEIEGAARASAQQGTYEINGVNMTAAQYLAETRMTELIDLMNSELNGRHLFGGNETEKNPVEQFDAVMNGKDGKAGFRTVMAQRKMADMGAANMGRLTTGIVGTAVSLSEDGTHPFGFKLDSLSSDGAAATLTGPAGAPPSLSVDFAAQPNDNERIIIGLDMPDGRTIQAQMKAVAGPPTSSNEFQIGGTTAATAANFKAALDTKLGELTKTDLVAASAFAASDNFFAANGETTQRVDGPPYDTATGLVAATDTDTVIWYTGQSATNPRQTVDARVDENTRVSYGAQANEDGPTRLIRSLAVFAAEGFSPSDPDAKLKYQSLNNAVRDRLSESHNSEKGSIEVIQMELGLAKTTNGRIAERQVQQKSMLDNMLVNIEEAPIEEVAMRILSLQTRMQASYQTASIVSKLSLVNYVQ
ncbi:hypothetical protein [uncultured Maritalea sp.]|uniref:hypothetical protein n=1 Tax=uncultured Maritalea sp. TaxID=757249 RepID=UPI0026331075|nr:hypothetical protein [uncultured Maritalea sp.]